MKSPSTTRSLFQFWLAILLDLALPGMLTWFFARRRYSVFPTTLNTDNFYTD